MAHLSLTFTSLILNATYSMVLVIANYEWLPGLTSFIWGYLSDRYGVKRLLVIGVLAYALSLVGVVKLKYIPIVIALASLGQAIAWPAILASTSGLSDECIGRRYGFSL